MFQGLLILMKFGCHNVAVQGLGSTKLQQNGRFNSESAGIRFVFSVFFPILGSPEEAGVG